MKSLITLLLCTLLMLAASPARSQEISNFQLEFGAVAYKFFCVACHGTDGKGDGPAASLLSTRPADLTQLAKRNGGVFPARRVADAIYGRTDVEGHLDFSMPRWGEIFAGEVDEFPEGSAVEAFISRRIARIVAYLATIQEQ